MNLLTEPPASPTPPRILVVDDNHLICGLQVLIFERAGYEVITAENGEDALIQLASDHFDLVITDREMPVLDGVSLMLALRSAGSGIPFIMFSGSVALAALPPAVVRELSATLPKPARPAEMLAAVEKALKSRSAGAGPRALADTGASIALC